MCFALRSRAIGGLSRGYVDRKKILREAYRLPGFGQPLRCGGWKKSISGRQRGLAQQCLFAYARAEAGAKKADLQSEAAEGPLLGISEPVCPVNHADPPCVTQGDLRSAAKSMAVAVHAGIEGSGQPVGSRVVHLFVGGLP